MGTSGSIDTANDRVFRTGDTMTGPLLIGALAGTTVNFASVTAGDTVGRFNVLANGTLEWSDGANPPDVVLYRSAADVLRIEDQVSIYRVGQAADAELRLSRDAGFLANIRMRTGTLDRWGLQTSNGAESGANAGSDFNIQRFDDAGVLISPNPLNISRTTGVVMINNPGLANGAVVSVDGAQPLTNKTYQGSGSPVTTGNISMKVTGDTQVRWTVDLGGTMSWSPGSGALDTTFGRTGVGILGSNAELRVTRSAAASLAHTALVTGDTVPRWQVTAGGTESWGSGSAAIDIGLSRVAAGALALSATGIAASFDIRTGAVSTTSLLRFSVGSVPRWELLKNATVETGGGSQTGSDFEIRAISDNGAATNATITITRANGNVVLPGSLRINGNVGFYNTAPVAKPTVTGSRGGNAALASLLTALAGQGLVTDSSTA